MNIAIKRLDPNLPDPVESRRRAAGRLVRFTYATVVFGILGFFVVYFGAPLVLLSGPGTVSSPRYVISFPFVVQVLEMKVVAGSTVKAGEEIGRVRSPEQDNIVANYMRALADVASRRSELRVKARVAREALDPAREYQRLTDQAADNVKETSASLSYRLELFRERASASKAVLSQEAEVEESITQLSDLDEMAARLRESLDAVQRAFAEGRVYAPVGGIIAANPLAHVGESLVAGSPFAEILDPADVFVDWYIPNERLFDPQVGQDVIVLFGNRRIYARIAQILPVSAVYGGTQSTVARERSATQIARIRFNPDAQLPPLNSTVNVRMYYADWAGRAAARFVRLLGLD
jgi:hypothetical protein